MTLWSRVDKLEKRTPPADRPRARLITDEGDPEEGAKLAELKAQGFNVIHRVLVSSRQQADETVH